MKIKTLRTIKQLKAMLDEKWPGSRYYKTEPDWFDRKFYMIDLYMNKTFYSTFRFKTRDEMLDYMTDWLQR